MARARRATGRYLTLTSPFGHAAFIEWFERLGENPRLLEPFAGANDLVRMAGEAGLVGTWTSYDLAPQAPGVSRRDTLRRFPRGFDAVITNPPWLARHAARRAGLAVEEMAFGEYPNLYEAALAKILASVGYAAVLVPDSFITTGRWRERLETVVSLPGLAFAGTEMPGALALFGPEATEDVALWRGATRLGWWSDLGRPLDATAQMDRVHFNDPRGAIGLRAVDDVARASIAFVDGDEVEPSRVREASRLVTRIHVVDLRADRVGEVIATANADLVAWRERTGDVALSAFKGVRADGWFRRRLDYASARRLLGDALARAGA